MMKSIINVLKNSMRPTRNMKRYLVALSIVLIATTLLVSISFVLASNTMHTSNAAGAETQFQLNVAYAYVGEGPFNDTSATATGALMSPRSQYPSVVEFNVTRLPGVQMSYCDAEIEIYSVQITASTGIMENNCYFIGTNYNPSFSSSELSSLTEHINSLISPKNLTTPIRGNFEFNMTDNTSILSIPIGSSGIYTTGNSSLGLWSIGKPNAISVTVQELATLQ